MKTRNILSASILMLGLSGLSYGDLDTIAAQPVTLSDSVGNEQSDFYYTESRKGAYVVFSGVLPDGKSTTLEKKDLFSVRMSDGLDNFFTQVTKTAPLKRLSSYKVPQGTLFDNFISAPLDNTFTFREIFHIPTRGLYMSTSGNAPVLIHVEKEGSPITGATVRFAENSPNDSDKGSQFRIVLGATVPKKGVEPLISSGTGPSTKLLTDIDPGATSSSPQLFTNSNDEAYFVATNPSSGDPEVYKVAVNTNSKKPAYSAATVSGPLPTTPTQLTGSGIGVFMVLPDSGDANTGLYFLPTGQSQFFQTQVENSGDASGITVVNPTQLTPAINGETLGFSVFDTSLNKTRMAYFETFDNIAVFTEVANTTAGTTTDPTNITSTGNYYYFGAKYSGAGPYVARVFTGSAEVEYISAVTANNFITNLQEIVDVPDSVFSGDIYFTGDAFVDNAQQTGILFGMDPEAADPIATPIRTIGNNLVHGARNLRAVTDSATIFRLYFTAPVSASENAEYSTDGKDHGTKPWVVNLD